jgi:hypothetical protein
VCPTGDLWPKQTAAITALPVIVSSRSADRAEILLVDTVLAALPPKIKGLAEWPWREAQVSRGWQALSRFLQLRLSNGPHRAGAEPARCSLGRCLQPDKPGRVARLATHRTIHIWRAVIYRQRRACAAAP